MECNGAERGTVNVAEATALKHALEWLSIGTGHQFREVLALGDSKLVIEFCAHKARPKLHLLALAVECISELRCMWRGRWVF